MCNKKAACIRKRVVYCTQTHYALSVRKEVCHSVKGESCDSRESLIFAQEPSICATRDACARVRVCVCVCVCVCECVCVCTTLLQRVDAARCNSWPYILQLTATHCNTLQHNGDTLQYTAILCNALRCIAIYCNTQQ